MTINDISDVDAMTLIATSAWVLEVEDGRTHQVPTVPAANHQALLRNLLRRTKRGHAWIASVPPRGPVLDPGQLPDLNDVELDWHEAHSPDIDTAIAGIVEKVRSAATELRDEPIVNERLRNESLEQARYRIFLDREQLQALCWLRNNDTIPAVDFCVLLDVRFVAAFSQLRCHVSVSVWSKTPQRKRYRPTDRKDAAMAVPLNGSMADYRDAFEVVVARVEALIDDHAADRVDYHLLGRPYELPVFWVVRPAQLATEPQYILHGSSDLIARAGRLLLRVGDIRDDAVAGSVVSLNDVEGRLLALRRVDRFHRVKGPVQDVPRYLLVPAGEPFHRDGGEVVLETVVGRVIKLLTDMETGILHLGDEVQAMEICRNHMVVYYAVVERGAFLWDALSTHLPIRMHGLLSRVHRTVALIHNFLLQGVADLGHIAALAEANHAEILRQADGLRDQYNQELTEEKAAMIERGLRSAVTEPRLLEQVRRHGDEIVAEGRRVTGAYRDLIGAIHNAFDERGVREADFMQRASLAFNAAAVTFGVVTVLDATMDLKVESVAERLGSPTTWAWVSLWLVGMQIYFVVMVILARMGRLGQLGSSRFRKIYDGRRRESGRYLEGSLGKSAELRTVSPTPWDRWLFQMKHRLFGRPTSAWKFLKDTSTDNLERLRMTLDPRREVDSDKRWDTHDQDYAAQFAWLWDTASEIDHLQRHDQVRRDIHSLGRQIEQWGLHALLLTERARRLHRYSLPRLTCLYRVVTRITAESVARAAVDAGQEPGPFRTVSFLEMSYVARPNLNAVAQADFMLSMVRLGFSWSESTRIDDWLHRRDFASARHALNEIYTLGLRPGMTVAERDAVLAIIDGRRVSLA